jgi:hypothetical protein
VPLDPFRFSYTTLPLLLQLLSLGVGGMSTPQEEVSLAWEAIIAV